MDNTPFSGCPRYRLESARSELKTLGLELRVGFELDFSIFRNKDGKLESIEHNNYDSANSLDELAGDLEIIYSDLKAMGVEVEALHK